MKKQKSTKRGHVSPPETLHVSIDRQSGQKAVKQGKPRKNQRPQVPSHQKASSNAGPLPIHFPRSRLKGYFGLPYSGEVHVLEAGSAPPPGQSVVGDDMLRLGPGGDIEFSMAPGVSDKEPQKGMYVGPVLAQHYCIMTV